MPEYERVRQGHERPGPRPGHGGECAPKILRTFHLDGLKLQSQSLGGNLCLFELADVASIGRVPQDGHPGDAGKRLVVELEALRRQLGEERGQPGDVSARAHEARREALANGIRKGDADDGNGRGRLP